MALQFGPQFLLLALTGFAADHLDRRKLLLATQAAMGALALGLGIPCTLYACYDDARLPSSVQKTGKFQRLNERVSDLLRVTLQTQSARSGPVSVLM
jgi:hypothetical protein